MEKIHLACLLSNMYMCEIDMILIGGDINTRLGHMKDYIEGLDNVPPRTIIDKKQNEHRKLSNDFLLQSKMCVVSGRVNPLKDSFTLISHKGRSVVDYFIISNDCIDNMLDFEVKT